LDDHSVVAWKTSPADDAQCSHPVFNFTDDIFETLSNNTLFGDEGCSLENATCSIAIFEIYGGRIQDLLNNRNRLKVLEDGKGEVIISGLEEFEATNPKEFLFLAVLIPT
jgi:hypothetical protein